MTQTTRLDLTPATPLDTRELVDAAFELRRSGDASRSLCAARVAYAREPCNPRVQSALAWAVESSLKRELESGNPSNRVIDACVHEYVKLEKVERPGLVHSMMIVRLARAAERWPGFTGFLRRFGYDQFMADDYVRKPKRGGEGAWPSLAEKAAKAVHKSLGPASPADLLEWAAGFFASIQVRQPEAEWIPYYRGKLLLGLGRVDEARALVLPVLRRHGRSFWAWEVLAEIHRLAGGEGAESRHGACLAQALAVGEKPEFLVKVRAAFAAHLAAAGRFAEARAEFEEIRRLRRAQGWKDDPEVERRLAGAEFAGLAPRPLAREELLAMARPAGECLFDDLPWRNAVLARRLPPADGKPGRIVFVAEDGDTVRPLFGPAERFPTLADLPVGAPLRLRAEREAAGAEGIPPRLRPIAAEPREGEAWDLLPPRVAAVVRKFQDGSGIIVAFPEGETASIHDRALVESVNPGDMMRVRACRDPFDGKSRVYEARPDAAEGRSGFRRLFAGKVTRREGKAFAFVDQGDASIYLPPELVDSKCIRDGDRVMGVALRLVNPKNGEFGWRAVRVEAQAGEEGDRS